MATNFPATSIDSYNTKTAGDTIEEGHVNNLQDAMVATETKVGKNSSSVISSHDYKLRHLPVQEANWDIGSYKLTAQQLESDIAIGTAPLIVASTTLVSNFNADQLDSQEGSYYLDCGNFSAGTLPIARGGTGSVSTTYCSLTTNVTGALPDSNLAAVTTANKVNTSALYGTTYLPNDTVDTTALKTTTGIISSASATAVAVVGGNYCFMPKIKASSTAGNWIHYGMGSTNSDFAGGLGTSYVGPYVSFGPDGNTLYAQTPYVTASGTDDWAYLLIDKNTKDIIIATFASDHISYGNGGNPDKIPHPFTNFYDPAKHEIILLDQATCKQLKQESEATIPGEGEDPEKCALTILNEDYKPNMSKKELYTPLHSGKSKRTLENGKEVVTKHMIETISDYISVRKLTKLTQAEKDERKAKQEAKRIANKQKKEEKKQNRISGKAKLVALGLNKEETSALIGE